MKFDARARYFPIDKGLYEVAPGLRKLGTDFGNGTADRRVFQIDEEFPRYHENKLRCRAERLNKYFAVHQLSSSSEKEFLTWFLAKLLEEYPEFFSLEKSSGNKKLLCAHTNDAFVFDDDFNILESSSTATPKFESAFDALALQVQEDLCLMQLEGKKNWLSAAHLCSPGHWSAESKIGTDFAKIHEPVPGIEKINRDAHTYIEAMISRGPYVRFAWGFSTDVRLNHHPETPVGEDLAKWVGRKFNSANDSKFYLRVERQVMWGFPQVQTALFTIRVSYVEGEEIKRDPDKREKLKSALLSMSAESRIYKGVHGSLDALMDWLG